ncbi:hypothetical protein M8818_002206 [Zalaria obscura]|uniref:Uncharacterized protein n=1 Tax=Zalaria obscura TaxID=2024903 RepID=A0ACC3SK67_9PEZI
MFSGDTDNRFEVACTAGFVIRGQAPSSGKTWRQQIVLDRVQSESNTVQGKDHSSLAQKMFHDFSTLPLRWPLLAHSYDELCGCPPRGCFSVMTS